MYNQRDMADRMLQMYLQIMIEMKKPVETPLLELHDRKYGDRGGFSRFHLNTKDNPKLNRLNDNGTAIESITLIFPTEESGAIIYENNLLIIKKASTTSFSRIHSSEKEYPIVTLIANAIEAMDHFNGIAEQAYNKINLIADWLTGPLKIPTNTLTTNRFDQLPTRWELEVKYVNEEINLYHELHRTVVDVVASKIIKKTDNIHLISLGCRHGDSIAVFKQQFGARLTSVVGIDICSESISKAKEKYANNTNWTFLTDHCTNLDTLIKPTPNQHTIAEAIGLLNRSVLTGTREALLVLQKAWRTKINTFVITGMTACLITEEMARMSGWQLQHFQFIKPRRRT